MYEMYLMNPLPKISLGEKVSGVGKENFEYSAWRPTFYGLQYIRQTVQHTADKQATRFSGGGVNMAARCSIASHTQVFLT